MSDVTMQKSAIDVGADEADLHPLLRDADRPGLWGWIDRTSDRATRWLNPILVKEARQSLKSKQFTVTFFLLLAASWFWMVAGVASLAPDIYHIPSGLPMMTGYYFLLAIPMMAMVPLAAYRSLTAEIDEGTFEMLAITRLSSLRIITGKLGSALLQMLIYFAALVPCFAFCYLLRGVDLMMIAVTIGLVFLVSVLLTSLGLLFATVVHNRTGQMLILLVLVGVIVFAEFLVAMFVLSALLPQRITWTREVTVFTMLFTIMGLSFVVLFIKAAAARIAPVTENRSTHLRWIMFVQQSMWIGCIATVAIWYSGDTSVTTFVNFGASVMAGYWLLMGTLMLGESAEMSPRVRRTLPQTTAGRMMLMWFNPGPGTGFMFAVTTGLAGILGISLFAVFMLQYGSGVFPLASGLLMTGYLCMYLGATRLITLPLSRRFGNSFILPLSVLGVLLLLGCTVPAIIMTLTTGSPSSTYGPIEATNWIWTLVIMLNDNTLPDFTVVIVASTGGLILSLNMFLLFREFSYRKIAVPTRVIRDAAESVNS